MNTRGDFVEMRSIDPHWHLVKSPLPVAEEERRRILDPEVIPRRRPLGRRHDAGVQRERSDDELLPPRAVRAAPPTAPPTASQPAQQPAIQRQERAPPRCTGCGQLGHRYNTPRCPLRGTEGM